MTQLDIGDAFAGYVIEGVLGRGGMGTVYLVRHPRLPMQLALKLLNPATSADDELRLRFEQEADVIARLEHPNIVDVYDRGVANGQLWIAMQYIRGSDAGQLAAPTLNVDRALTVVAETANALDYAHIQGVLHRDVKPANILLAAPDAGRTERAVLTDFGIARLTDSDSGLTATGTFTATLSYAAPEQLSGESIDHRADQYSLACTLFVLLTGRAPFDHTNPGQVIAAHLSKPVPPVSALRPDLPTTLDAVIGRAMAKQPGQRFVNCGEFAAAARAAMTQQASPGPERFAETVHAQPPPPPAPSFTPGWVPPAGAAWPPAPATPWPPAPQRRSRMPVALAAAVSLVVVLVGAGIIWGPRLVEMVGTRSWSSSAQAIADTFPGLVSERENGKGWLDLECTQMSPGVEPGAESGIECEDENIDHRMLVMDFGNPAAAAAYIEEATQAERREYHPDFPDPLPVTSVYAGADVAAGFPDDPERAKFVVYMYKKYPEADRADVDQEVLEERVLDEMWREAPLGK